MDGLDLTSAVDHTSLRLARRRATAATAVILLLTLVFPSHVSQALRRLWQYDVEFAPPVRYTVVVLPGSTDIVSGSDVEISVLVQGAPASPAPATPPSWVDIRWRPLGQTSFESRRILMEGAGEYRTILKALRVSIDYAATVDGQTTDLYRLTVLEKPLIRALEVRLVPPAYTKLPVRALDPFAGDVTALPGTLVTIAGTASKELSSGFLRFNDTTDRPLTLAGMSFSGSFTVRRDAFYRVEITDTAGLTNPDPISYRVHALADQPPSITILYPGQNLDVAGNDPLTLLVRIADDFGFSRLLLHHRLIHSRFEPPQEQYRTLQLPLPPAQQLAADVSFPWDLKPLALAPEDVVEYYIEVFDNDTVGGPKAARSPLYLLRLPSLEEVFADLDTSHRELTEDLAESLAQAEELKQQLESIQEDLRKNRAPDWRQDRKTEELRREYESIQKNLNRAAERLDKIVQQMQQQPVLSPETLEKYLELQQLIQELNASDLQEALRRFQQALQTVNRDQLQQALQQMEFSEERFRGSIERTLNLLKRMQIEQKLDEVRKRAEQLRERQEELATASDSLQPDDARRDALARQQEQLQRMADELLRQSDDLQHRMEEFFTEMPADRLADLNRAMRSEEIGEKMQRAAVELRLGQTHQAQQSQAQIAKNLADFSRGLDSIQRQLLDRQMDELLAQLRHATDDLLELSKRQEALKEDARSAPQNSPQLRQNAQEQLHLSQALTNLIHQLVEFSQRSFAITPEMGKSVGTALARMQNALRHLETRSGSAAAQEQSAAMSALNEAALQFQSALQALLQAGGGGAGLFQQLQRLAGQQLSVNAQVERLAAMDAAERAAEAARLALEQEAVRKSLQELEQEARTSMDGRRILGDLERITEEMREVVRSLQQNAVHQETLERQERILSRLLDASRSMRERDYEKQRRARPGTAITRRSPADLDPEKLQRQDRLRQDLLRALERGYTKDYRELIQKYFEELLRAQQEQ
jgi:hypothetical protein